MSLCLFELQNNLHEQFDFLDIDHNTFLNYDSYQFGCQIHQRDFSPQNLSHGFISIKQKN